MEVETAAKSEDLVALSDKKLSPYEFWEKIGCPKKIGTVSVNP
jgi:hypothetical protein